jgi:hypothetical protein
MDEQPQAQPNRTLTRRLYLLSALVALATLTLILLIWFRTYTAPPPLYPDDTILTTPEQVTQYQNKLVPPPAAGEEPPMYIPTGVFLQSLEFKGPYTIQAAGYVWQRYADSLPQDLDKGFVLPEGENVMINEIYRTHQGNEELIGWFFRATLRQQFDYSRYPLDRQQIWLQMWHRDFERNVYLAPDLAAYPYIDPNALPGLDSDLVLENWQIEQSFFSYRPGRYNANFGIQGYDSEQPEPELYFNIAIKRYIWSSLIARLLVPLVILLQLFVIVMVIGSDNKRLEQFGVRPGAVIFTCAAFFFAVLVAQNALRDEVKSYGVVYLETIHILTYLVILAVAANSVLLVAFPHIGLFQDNDNLWVEVLYWPLILLILLLITFVMFAPIR